MTALRLIVNAAAGKMGARVAALAAADPRFELVACAFHERRGETHGAQPLTPAELADWLSRADVLVDFSVPRASLSVARAAAAARRPAVIGTTGFSAAERRELARLSRRTALFVSPNFSPAAHALFALASRAARWLPAYEKAIVETHHKQKRDAPSGTALRLAAEAGGGVPIKSQRIGDVVGEHTITFAGPFERLELTHRAHSRDLFARGALDAAAWLRRRRTGLYDVPDMLGL